MPSINDPETPDVIDPVPHGVMAGDWKDDDAQALDAYFEAADLGPQVYDAVLEKEDPSIPAATRILTKSFVLASPDNTNPPDPVMALPADPNRTVLRMCVQGIGIKIGSAKNDVYGSPLMIDPVGNWVVFDMSGHTGALWIYNPSPITNSAATVAIWAVTS